MMKKNRLLALLVALVIALCGAFSLGSGQPARAESLVAQSEFKTLKVGNGGQAVRQMQAVLLELGYYDGRIDGNFSRAFETAVKEFQADFGIEITGKIDYELYTLLYEEFSSFPTQTPGLATPRPTPTPRPANIWNLWGLFEAEPTEDPFHVVEGEYYTDKEHVAAYLKKFECLPDNYITKEEARKLGWNNSRRGLWDVAPGMSIGGDRFGNYEGILPEARNRKYYECDIDFEGEANAKRIVYSNDGLIFYTEDHYETFEEVLVP